MTDTELIEAVKRGERINPEHSFHASVVADACQYGVHTGGRWRTIACNDEQDVVECSQCGAQRVTRCNFDEEYA